MSRDSPSVPSRPVVHTSNSLSQCLTTISPSENDGLFSLRTIMTAWLPRRNKISNWDSHDEETLIRQERTKL